MSTSLATISKLTSWCGICTNVLVWHMHQRLGVARAPRVTSRCFLFSHVQDKHPNTSDTRQEKRKETHDACRCDGFRRRSQAPTLHSIRTPRSRTTTTTKSEPTIYDSPAAAGRCSAELSRRFGLKVKMGGGRTRKTARCVAGIDSFHICLASAPLRSARLRHKGRRLLLRQRVRAHIEAVAAAAAAARRTVAIGRSAAWIHRESRASDAAV